MRIMTFNLRFENDQDGANAWSCRRDLVVKLIEEYAPDILGTQEGRISPLAYLDAHLPKYDIHMPSRVIDKTCQYPTLFLRKDRFRILEGKEFWLSKTPKIHRSKNWDSAFPRMLSTATLELRESGQVFSVAVTHLDHMGQTARLKQAEIISRWVQKKTVPVILMGDFNDGPHSDVHTALASSQTGLSDAWQMLGHAEGKESFTHHGFTGVPKKSRIDWILSSTPPYAVDARLLHDHFDGRYPSDHFPYYVDFTWKTLE